MLGRVQPGNRLGGLLLVGAVSLAFGGLGIYYFFDMRAEGEFLDSHGVQAVAHVISSYRLPGRGGGIKANVMFTTIDGELVSQDLESCDYESLTAETEYLTVVYNPEDPSFVRPAACAGLNRLAWIALFGGLALWAYFAFLILRFVRGKKGP